jgi:hypothetical protein
MTPRKHERSSREHRSTVRRRFLPDDAYEHDYKLVNTSNPDLRGCTRSASAALPLLGYSKRPDMGYELPCAAKPYFDTDDSDSCRTQDFTIGCTTQRS